MEKNEKVAAIDKYMKMQLACIENMYKCELHQAENDYQV